MDPRTYQKLYSKLSNPEDAKRLAGETGLKREVLLAILSLKIVRNTRRRYHELEGNSEKLIQTWINGKSFAELSKELDFPPVLTASIILQSKGMKRREVWKLLKGAREAPDDRTSKELKEAVREDFLYSPWAHELQQKRAAAGEKILEEWLLSIGADFIREFNFDNNGPTPDFLLREKMPMDNQRISWIESKAVFGDGIEHARYMRKQLTPYLNELGGGMVVYWYGHVESISEPRVIIKDYEFFHGQKEMIKELFRLSRW